MDVHYRMFTQLTILIAFQYYSPKFPFLLCAFGRVESDWISRIDAAIVIRSRLLLLSGHNNSLYSFNCSSVHLYCTKVILNTRKADIFMNNIEKECWKSDKGDRSYSNSSGDVCLKKNALKVRENTKWVNVGRGGGWEWKGVANRWHKTRREGTKFKRKDMKIRNETLSRSLAKQLKTLFIVLSYFFQFRKTIETRWNWSVPYSFVFRET